MASSSDSFSSALSHALERLGTPNLKNSGSPSRWYTKEILCSYSYRQDLDPSSLATPVVVEGRASVWINKRLLLLATCFMSNQICRVGGSLWFLFDSYALLLYRTLLLVNTRLRFVIMEQHAFGICAFSLFG